ncbi:MAG TPA: hypothetical protein VHT68_05365 [Pseudolabrys sp.]|nr:hypothetical protein [Pseudolabrys sp.]
MKKMILSAAVAMLLASPAFAQSYSSSYGTGNVINQPALEHGGPAWQGEFQGRSRGGFQGGPYAQGSYAYEPPRATGHKHRGVRAETISPADPDVVYENGQYVGRDPDRMCGSSCAATGLTTDRPLSDSGTPKQASAQGPAFRRSFLPIYCPVM